MDLFLASTIEGTIDKLISEYAFTPGKTRVAYIATAQNCYTPVPTLTERGSYQCLIERGFPITVLNFEDETSETLEQKLRGVPLIVCAGGNTYYLLYHMNKSGFAKLLPSLLSTGVVYSGSSAGSCVCSPNIAYVKDQDDPKMAPELTDYTGLGLVDFEVYPHCIEEYYAQNYDKTYIFDALKSPAKKIFLRDHQAVVVKDTWYRVI